MNASTHGVGFKGVPSIKTTALIFLFSFLAAMSWFPGQSRAAEKPVSSEAMAGPEGKVVQVIQSPIQVRPRQPGAYENVFVTLDLDGVSSAEIRITGYDIDAVEETVMTINGTEVSLPREIVADMRDSTVKIPIPKSILRQGKNEIGFLFAKAVGGTSGFSILDLQVVLHGQ